MKNNKQAKLSLIALAVIQMATHSVYAARYDAVEDPLKDDLSSISKIGPADMSVSEEQRKQAREQFKNNYLHAVELFKQQKYAEARTEVNGLIKKNAKEPLYYNLLALLEIQSKNEKAAEQNFKKAIELDNRNAQSLLGLAMLNVTQKQYDQAKKLANQALELDNKNVNAHQLLADVALQTGGPKASEEVLLNAKKILQGSTVEDELKVAVSLGKVYAMLKQPESFLKSTEELLSRYPEDTGVLSLLAQAQAANNKKDLAEKTLNQIIGKTPRDVGHRLMLAGLLNEHGDKQKETLELLDQVLEIEPNQAQALSFKHNLLLGQKEFDKALEIAEKTQTIYPKGNLGLVMKADTMLAQARFDEALVIYQDAYRISPNDKLMDMVLAVLNKQGKQQQGVDFLKKELAKNDKNAAVIFRLGTAYQGLNQLDLAAKQYEKLMQMKDDNVLVLNNLAWVYGLQNNPKALGLAEKAYAQAPKAPTIADTYGYILMKQGKVKEALNVLEPAAQAAPQMAELQVHLAEAYIAANDKDKAKALLQKVVEGNSSFKDKAQELLGKL